MNRSKKKDTQAFLTKKIAEEGGIYPCILNAANEITVKSFIEEKIKFLDIHTIIEKLLVILKTQMLLILMRS
ncbi:MAG: hypothetical protein CM15mP93_08610 [Thiotrichaceae bacterium]|nr:MAG: hypothetical protein CM15mP93_08610 [Thiotrichaceae bacterium]